MKFCSICKKANHSLERGILCSLTHEKPSFKESCSHFEPVSDEVEIPDFTQATPDPAETYIESISSFWRNREYKVSEYHNQSFTPGQLSKIPARYNFLYSNFSAMVRISIGIIFILGSAYLAYSDFSIVYVLPSILFGMYFFYIGYNRNNKVDDQTYFTRDKIYTRKNPPIQWEDVEYILDISTSKKETSFAGVKLYRRKEPVELFTVDIYKIEKDELFELMEMYRYQARQTP